MGKKRIDWIIPIPLSRHHSNLNDNWVDSEWTPNFERMNHKWNNTTSYVEKQNISIRSAIISIRFWELLQSTMFLHLYSILLVDHRTTSVHTETVLPFFHREVVFFISLIVIPRKLNRKIFPTTNTHCTVQRYNQTIDSVELS